MLDTEFGSRLQFPLHADPGRQLAICQAARSLPPMRETCVEFLLPGFGLPIFWPVHAFRVNLRKGVHFAYLFLSDIQNLKGKKKSPNENRYPPTTLYMYEIMGNEQERN